MVWGSRARSRPRVGFGEGSSIERLREEEGKARRGEAAGVEWKGNGRTERSDREVVAKWVVFWCFWPGRTERGALRRVFLLDFPPFLPFPFFFRMVATIP